mgnify:CR=1 FL=1
MQLFTLMLTASWIDGGDGEFHPEHGERLSTTQSVVRYRLTECGADGLTNWGVADKPTARVLADKRGLRYCVDWTEQKHHLAGYLGNAICAHFLSNSGFSAEKPLGLQSLPAAVEKS